MKLFQNRTGKIAYMGLLTALALIVSYVEFLIPIPIGIPGVKPGLANIAVMYALFFLGVPQAMTLVVLKAAFVFITRGMVAGALSLSGGATALLIMILLCSCIWIANIMNNNCINIFKLDSAT